MLKVYTAHNHANFWSCTIEINEEFIISDRSKPDAPFNTLMQMEELVLFWHGGTERLKSQNGDIAKAFVQQLGLSIFSIQTEDNFSVEGIISEFDNREGWCKMDGSSGIKIIDADEFNLSYDDFYIEEALK